MMDVELRRLRLGEQEVVLARCEGVVERSRLAPLLRLGIHDERVRRDLADVLAQVVPPQLHHQLGRSIDPVVA